MADLAQSKFRDRLPKELSYPVTASDVAKAFEGSPGCPSVSFWIRPPGVQASEHAALLKSGAPLPALSAWYSNPRSQVPSAALARQPQHLYDESFSVHVYAVPRPHKRTIGDALQQGGLMAIRRWLETPRPATWFQGFKKCVVAVDPDRGELSIEATG